jgi:hypothetical protein
MKNIIFTLILTVLSTSLFAQIHKVQELNASMTQGTNRGFKVLLAETSVKEAIKAWSKLMKEYDSKTGKVKTGEDYLSPDASIPTLGELPVDVYAQFQETQAGTYITVFFDIEGVYLNSDMNKEQTVAAIALLQLFANTVAKESIAEKVKDETKKLEKLEKDQKNLIKDKEGYEKDIKDAKKTIEQRQNSLKENAAAQESIKKKLAEQAAITTKIKAKMSNYE